MYITENLCPVKVVKKLGESLDKASSVVCCYCYMSKVLGVRNTISNT